MDIYLSFEFMESDLHNVIKRGSILKDIHKRYVIYQLLNATNFIHSGNVIHRDLKPSNVLVDSKCRYIRYPRPHTHTQTHCKLIRFENCFYFHRKLLQVQISRFRSSTLHIPPLPNHWPNDKWNGNHWAMPNGLCGNALVPCTGDFNSQQTVYERYWYVELGVYFGWNVPWEAVVSRKLHN